MKHIIQHRLFSRVLVTCIACLMSYSAQAIHLSTFRIYLDQDQRSTSFIVYNRDVQPQDCALKLRHYIFDDTGEMVEYKGDGVPDNSAKDWIRFSPRNFVLSPTNSQTIRFSMRRKANAGAAEYRSYLSIDCGIAKKDGEKEQMINIKPKLVHNVPIIVRTKALDVDVKFSNFKIKDGLLNFDLERTGDRSVYGSLHIVDKADGKNISGSNGISVYTETTRHPFTFSLRNHKPEDVMIKFVEDSTYGGEKEFTQEVVLN